MNMKTSAGLTAALLLGSISALAQMGNGSAKPAYEGVATPPPDDYSVAQPSAKPSPDVPLTAPAPGMAGTDAGPVTTTATPEPVAAPSLPAPVLKTRPAATPALVSGPTTAPVDPDSTYVQFVPVKPGELAQGTVIKMRLNEALSTATTQPGALFTGEVTQDVVQNGAVAIPANALVRGRVMSISAGHRGIRGNATIRLRPDEIVLPDGSKYYIHATPIDTTRSDTKVNDEGDIQNKDHAKRTLAEVGFVGGSSAVVGATVGGLPGAVIGGVIGVGIVTTHWLMQDHQATLPRNSEVALGFTEPMSLTPMHQ